MTGRIIPLDGDAHAKVQELLPWYLSGGLNDDEQAMVRQHLGACADCQAELQAERRLAAEVAAAPSAPVLDVEHGWAAMSGHLQREALPGRRALRAGGRIAAQFRSGAPWMSWALAAQAACLALTVGALVYETSKPPTFRALGAVEPVAAGNVVVIFQPDTREGDLRRILKDGGARLVDGPTAADAYVLHVSPEVREEALAKLRAQAQIVLAEPIDSGGPS